MWTGSLIQTSSLIQSTAAALFASSSFENGWQTLWRIFFPAIISWIHILLHAGLQIKAIASWRTEPRFWHAPLTFTSCSTYHVIHMQFFCIQLWKTAADSAFHVTLLLTLHIETKCQATFVPNLLYFKVSIPAVTETQAEFVHSLCQSMSPSKLQQQDNTYSRSTGWQQGHYVPFKSLSPGTNTKP